MYRLVLLFSFLLSFTGLAAQTTLYSEDFEDANDVTGSSGLYNDVFTAPLDANWSLVEVGNADVNGGGDHCGVVAGKYLEWKDNNCGTNAANGHVEWFSTTYSGSATSVSISIDWTANDASSGTGNTGLQIHYNLDGGGWTQLGANHITNAGLISGTGSITGLTVATSIQLRVSGWSGDAGGATVTIDDILIEGVLAAACTAPTIEPSDPTFGTVTTT